MRKLANPFWVGLSIIWMSHILMDFMLGVWTIYKTLAGLNLVVAGSIAGASIFIGEGLQLYFGYLSDRRISAKTVDIRNRINSNDSFSGLY
jgi:hypothetical protein